MTGRDLRDLERRVDALAPAPDSDREPDLTEAEAAALRAIDSFRIRSRIEDEPSYTPAGRLQYSRAFLEEALASVDDDLEQAFRDRWIPGAVR